MTSDRSGFTFGDQEDFLDLFVILFFSLIALVIVLIMPDGNILRIIFGIPLLLFIPGYALVSVLWPEAGKIGNEDRFALSFGLSIAIVSVIALILVYTIEISVGKFIGLLTVAVILLIILAIIRRMSIPKNKRYHISLVPDFNKAFRDAMLADKIMTIALICILLISVIGLAYVLVTPSDGEKYTEFYIMDSNGTTENYPLNITTNDTATIIVGIRCHEYAQVNYRVVIGIENATTINDHNDWNQTFIFTNSSAVGRDMILDHNGVFEDNISFNIPNPGRYKVVWQLYMDGIESEYELHQWVNVHID